MQKLEMIFLKDVLYPCSSVKSVVCHLDSGRLSEGLAGEHRLPLKPTGLIREIGINPRLDLLFY
jgi:hypothetical protein